MPMALFALISWLKNPYNGNKAEVKVNSISKKEQILMWILTIIVTVVFFYILDFFNTANILILLICIVNYINNFIDCGKEYAQKVTNKLGLFFAKSIVAFNFPAFSSFASVMCAGLGSASSKMRFSL